MGDATRPRGRRDTGSRPFIVALWVAALLHVPFVPLNILGWMRILLEPRDQEIAEIDGEAIIPIEFDFGPDEERPPAEAPEAKTTVADVEGIDLDAGARPERPRRKPRPDLDAGADAADAAGGEDADIYAEIERDAGMAGTPGGDDAGIVVPAIPDAGPVDAGPDAAPDDAGPDAGPTVKDPLSVASSSLKFFKHPNVQLWVSSRRIRNHELGAQVSHLLTTIPEWRGFFGGTGLEPIRDLDELIIAGPQFRDARKVTAMMYYNVPEKKVRGAIDHIVANATPKGEWLKDAPVTAAVAMVDRGERIFAVVPAKRLLAVLPPELRGQLGELKGAKPLAQPSVAILASTIIPSKALSELPLVKIPASLTWMGISISPTPDGGADLVIEAADASAEEAAKHAPELTSGFDELRTIALVPLFSKMQFVASGKRLKASTHASSIQIRLILARVEKMLLDKAQARADRPAREAEAGAGPEAGAGAPRGR